MCLNHVGGWFSKTQRDKKFDPGYWIKFLEPPWGPVHIPEARRGREPQGILLNPR